jgi:hypothetical protein
VPLVFQAFGASLMELAVKNLGIAGGWQINYDRIVSFLTYAIIFIFFDALMFGKNRKVIGGIASLAMGALFCIPLVVIAWARIFQEGMSQNDMVVPSEQWISSFSVGNHDFSGWQFWAAVFTLTLLGIAFVLVGFFALKSRSLSPRN